MNTKSFVWIVVILVLLSGFLIWSMNRPDTLGDINGAGNAEENGGNGVATEELHPADADTPTAPVCAFQEGETVTFTLSDGIPAPRCARALAGQTITFANSTSAELSFPFADLLVVVEPGIAVSGDEPVEEYLAPGVHKISMDLYGGSGPEVWVMDSSVREVEGTVEQTFVSAEAVVLDVGLSEELNVAMDEETRIFDADGSGISMDSFSTVLVPGTRVSAIIDFENEEVGTALVVRIVRE